MAKTELVKVKYNNDLNFLQLPKLSGRQQDLFFAVLSQIKDLQEYKESNEENKIKNKSKSIQEMNFFNNEKRELIIPYENFVKLCKINAWGRGSDEVFSEIEDFMDKLLHFVISGKTERYNYRFVAFEKAVHDKLDQTINIIFQKDFYEMAVNYSLGYTIFELEEFLSLSGRYSKILYRFLKQYRTQGKAPLSPMQIDEFRRVMDIPKNYNFFDVERRVLKPSIKELSEPTLFNQVPFNKLEYLKFDKNVEKIKEKNNKTKGRKPRTEFIQFTFVAQEMKEEITNISTNTISNQQISSDKKQSELLQLAENLNDKFKYKNNNEETTMKIKNKIDLLNNRFQNKKYISNIGTICQILRFIAVEEKIYCCYIDLEINENKEELFTKSYEEFKKDLPILIKKYYDLENINFS